MSVEALTFFGFLLGWAGGDLPLYPEGGSVRWVTKPHRRLADVVSRTYDGLDVEAGLPCLDRSGGPAGATVLWCWIQGGQQEGLAAAFRPLPSFVLRMGTSSRRLLVWSLDRCLPIGEVESGNRRIAYSFRAPQKWARVFRAPLPGTLLRLGRTRPVPVNVTRMELDGFEPRVIVGRLDDPPERRWK